ncbi:MAG: prolipoprotein diacylglyceryl transferase [Rubrobacter sp.]
MLFTGLLLSIPSPPSPIIFEAGPFALRYYGLCIALGIAVGTWLTSRELDRRGYDGALALDSLLFLIIPGFIGARIYHVATNYGDYAADPIPGVFEVWNGGIAIFGAVAGGALGAAFFCWYRGISLLDFGDSAAPGLILAQAFGRWGNYFNQELFGRPTDLPWAIRIAPENRPLGYADATTFHPTFLYESILNVLICLALLYIARRFVGWLRAGDIFIIYVALYTTIRVFMETLRIDPAFLIGGEFRGNLLVAAILALLAAMTLLMRHARPAKSSPR